MRNFSVILLISIVIVLSIKIIYFPKVVQVDTVLIEYRDTLLVEYDSLLLLKNNIDSVLNKQLKENAKLKKDNKATRDSIMLISNSEHSIWFDEWTKRLYEDSTFISN